MIRVIVNMPIKDAKRIFDTSFSFLRGMDGNRKPYLLEVLKNGFQAAKLINLTVRGGRVSYFSKECWIESYIGNYLRATIDISSKDFLLSRELRMSQQEDRDFGQNPISREVEPWLNDDNEELLEWASARIKLHSGSASLR